MNFKRDQIVYRILEGDQVAWARVAEDSATDGFLIFRRDEIVPEEKLFWYATPEEAIEDEIGNLKTKIEGMELTIQRDRGIIANLDAKRGRKFGPGHGGQGSPA